MSTHQASGLLSLRDRRRTDPEVARRGAIGERRRAPVLGIVSGKGGVGKSTLAINVASAAGALRTQTLLLDCDFGLANVDLLLGLVPACDLEDWSDGRAPLRDTISTGPGGVQVIVSGAGIAVADRIRRAIESDAANELSELIARQDLTILDLGAGISDRVLALAGACDLIWLVVTPEPTSLADAYATAKQLWQRSPSQRIELVVNRVREGRGGERTVQALNRLTQRFLSRSLPLRAVLPEDPAMIRSVSRQVPVIVEAPNSPAARRLRLLAESLLDDRASARSGAFDGPLPLDLLAR